MRTNALLAFIPAHRWQSQDAAIWSRLAVIRLRRSLSHVFRPQIKGKTASASADDEEEEGEEDDEKPDGVEEIKMPAKQKTIEGKKEHKAHGIHEDWSKLVSRPASGLGPEH